jgi:zinc transport system substrate-binding protein
MKLKRTCLISLVLLAVACSGEAPGPEAEEKAVLSVYVTNYPLKYFAERIGGDRVAVSFPAPADEDPAFWVPDPDVVAGYQSADLILLNGAGYEQWIAKVSLPDSRITVTSASFKDRYLSLENVVTHSHGPSGEHEHGGTAFTTWLDPELAAAQADAVRAALAKAKAGDAALFQKNFDALKKDLEELDAKLAALVNGEIPVCFSHPVYQYFARRYGVNGKSVHWEPGEAPDAGMWVAFRELLEGHPVKWMIWEGEPLEDTVKRLDEAGIRSAVFDPCGNSPEEGDYLSVMKGNIEAMKRVFGT